MEIIDDSMIVIAPSRGHGTFASFRLSNDANGVVKKKATAAVTSDFATARGLALQMRFEDVPPPPPSIRAQIRAIPPGKSVLIRGAKKNTVASLACVVAAELGRKGQFITRQEGEGIRVWHLEHGPKPEITNGEVQTGRLQPVAKTPRRSVGRPRGKMGAARTEPKSAPKTRSSTSQDGEGR